MQFPLSFHHLVFLQIPHLTFQTSRKLSQHQVLLFQYDLHFKRILFLLELYKKDLNHFLNNASISKFYVI